MARPGCWPSPNATGHHPAGNAETVAHVGRGAGTTAVLDTDTR
jgi:hypothetical protein|eukprot:COSAG01_NODE_2161_length_8268_cov_23.645122_9_plen_43_part_00